MRLRAGRIDEATTLVPLYLRAPAIGPQGGVGGEVWAGGAMSDVGGHVPAQGARCAMCGCDLYLRSVRAWRTTGRAPVLRVVGN